MMKNKSFLAAVLLSMPLIAWGQSGMYTMSSKKSAKTQTETPSDVEIIYVDEDEPVTTGPVRDVDEYNRRGYTSTVSDSIPVIHYADDGTLSSIETEAYNDGYQAGFSDAEDYTLTRRLGRFAYSSIYSSPYYWDYYNDPFYWNDWYWGAYDPYYYYGWSRPYWGYYSSWYYRPYWYGYGWNRPYYGGYYYPSHRGYRSHDYVSRSGRRPGQTGRSATYSSGRRVDNLGRTTSRSAGYQNRSASSRTVTSRSTGSSTSRSTNYGGNRVGSFGSSSSSTRSSSVRSSSSSSTRSSSSGSSFGGSSRSSSFGGGSHSSYSGGGGSRGGGRGR